ncbi:hypothetical protein Ddye_004486 [Dipteronia dyeriana]|uniref:Uncharacterized protein n=1 Tax=Dipteronia dyeriana TaxID=168575 RepID=A0AAD9XVT5_9ROSI|nr:hypothetical protein Ddye_004486 [Dipteronia dyeriana]
MRGADVLFSLALLQDSVLVCLLDQHAPVKFFKNAMVALANGFGIDNLLLVKIQACLDRRLDRGTESGGVQAIKRGMDRDGGKVPRPRHRERSTPVVLTWCEPRLRGDLGDIVGFLVRILESVVWGLGFGVWGLGVR